MKKSGGWNSYYVDFTGVDEETNEALFKIPVIEDNCKVPFKELPEWLQILIHKAVCDPRKWSRATARCLVSYKKPRRYAEWVKRGVSRHKAANSDNYPHLY